MGTATIPLCKFWDDTNIPNSLSKEHHFLTLTNLVESLNEPDKGGKGGKSCVCRGKCGSFQPGTPRGTNPGKALHEPPAATQRILLPPPALPGGEKKKSHFL